MSRGRRNPRNEHRTQRVNELLRRIVADELEQIDDEDLALVSVTAVETDRDLTHATVYVSSLAGEDDDGRLLENLESHRRRLQRAIGDQARLRGVPPLHFRIDESARSAERIESILRGLDTGDETGGE